MGEAVRPISSLLSPKVTIGLLVLLSAFGFPAFVLAHIYFFNPVFDQKLGAKFLFHQRDPVLPHFSNTWHLVLGGHADFRNCSLSILLLERERAMEAI